MMDNTKLQSNDYVVGIVEGSSTYYSCTPASPSPRRLVLILIATRYLKLSEQHLKSESTANF